MDSTRREVEQVVMEYISYLASSAYTVLSEPRLYGSLRLIDAVTRFINMLNTLAIPLSNELRQFLNEIAQLIEENEHKVMTDPESYKAMLREVLTKLARKSRELL